MLYLHLNLKSERLLSYVSMKNDEVRIPHGHGKEKIQVFKLQGYMYELICSSY